MIPAPDGFQYGVMFEDGSVAHRWNGRTQRQRAEEYLADLNVRWDTYQVVLVRRRDGGAWEPVLS